MCSQPLIITSVLDLWAKSVTMNVNGVRQDRDGGDKNLLLFARLARPATVSSSVCVQPPVSIFQDPLMKQQSEIILAGALSQDVPAESFLAGRHATQCKDR